MNDDFKTRVQSEATGLAFALCLMLGYGLAWPFVESEYHSLCNGLLLTTLIGLQLNVARKNEALQRSSESNLELHLALAHDRQVYQSYVGISKSLLLVSQSAEPTYRTVAAKCIESIGQRLQMLAEGTIEFEGTETWRLAYEQLLRSQPVYQYRSVALIESDTYWQDGPGRKSLQVNFDLIEQKRLTVDRIAIVNDQFWPPGQRLPRTSILRWLDKQHERGVRLSLVRLSSLSTERDAIRDMGIYGSHVVGYHDFGGSKGTHRFTLKFNFDEVSIAEERWQRLAIHAIAYQEMLDEIS